MYGIRCIPEQWHCQAAAEQRLTRDGNLKAANGGGAAGHMRMSDQMHATVWKTRPSDAGATSKPVLNLHDRLIARSHRACSRPAGNFTGAACEATELTWTDAAATASALQLVAPAVLAASTPLTYESHYFGIWLPDFLCDPTVRRVALTVHFQCHVHS